LKQHPESGTSGRAKKPSAITRQIDVEFKWMLKMTFPSSNPPTPGSHGNARVESRRVELGMAAAILKVANFYDF
jgi:hypothetical protein